MAVIITLPCHKLPPHHRLAESNSCISVRALLHLFSCLVIFYSVSPPLFFHISSSFLFSAPSFLIPSSSLSSPLWKMGYQQTFILPRSHFSSVIPPLFPPLSSSSFPLSHPHLLLLFLLLSFLPSSFLTPALSLQTPLSHFLTSFVTVCSS